MSNTIREIIGENREKFLVNHSDSIHWCIAYMRDKNVADVAVCEQGAVVGVFSARSLFGRLLVQPVGQDKLSVEQVMMSPVHWISMQESSEVAMAIMLDKGQRLLAVKDEQALFKGFISVGDLAEADLNDSRERQRKANDDCCKRRLQRCI